MFKKVRVNYPKKKKPVKEEDLAEVNEPERKSMYEVLKDNLKIANRATFLHRIIYIGEHTFFTFDDGKETFQRIITRCNETYCIDKLTGFFLFYNNYFVHMVEGDEDNLNKHLGFLLDKSAKHQVFLGNMKLLIHVSHINQRFFDGWITFTGTPPKLLEKLDVQADMIQSGRHVYNCIKKMYSLMTLYVSEEDYLDDQQDASGGGPRRSVIRSVDQSSQRSSDRAESMSVSRAPPMYSSMQMGGMTSAQMMATSRMLSFMTSKAGSEQENIPIKSESKFKIYLPEYELLDFVLKTSFSMKLQDYYSIYGVVPMRDIYKDRVWPVPHDFIPYDVFEKPYDCITEIPKDRDSRTDGLSSIGLSRIKIRKSAKSASRSMVRSHSKAGLPLAGSRHELEQVVSSMKMTPSEMVQ